MYHIRNHIHFFYAFTAIMVLCSCNKSTSTEKNTLFNSLDPKIHGVDFENTLTYTEEFNTYLYRSFYNGAGVGLADLNNDGLLDLFFCGNQVDNKLYLGDGKFNFKDITKEAGVTSSNAWSTGVSIVDINQDGWLDIYVCKSGDPNDKNRRNELFINKGLNQDGIPVFEEKAADYGINDLGFSIHALFFDYDLDGDLDMYLSNNSVSPTDMIVDAKKGMREIEDGSEGDKLYRNDGNTFTNVSKEAGIYSSAIGFGLGTSVGDVNCDRWPDIYVANDFFEKDYLYLNNQDGTFTESIDVAINELSLGSMGVDMADMNHDGYPEIFVTEMLPEKESRLKTKTEFESWDKYNLKIRNGYHHQFSRNSFQINQGKLGMNNKIAFSEISRYAGVAATDWSWGVQIVDLDLDGTNEIFVTNGIAKDLLDQDYIDFYYNPENIRKILREKGTVITDLIDHIPSNPIANYVYKEEGNLKFKNVAEEWGMHQPSFSSGAAYGDIDNDGDLDIVVSNIDAPPFIYKNNSAKEDNNHVTFNLKNQNGATAIGAKVIATIGSEKQYKELYPMRGVMSSIDDRLNFGLGKARFIDTLEIIWPNNTRFLEKNIPGNSFLTYQQPKEKSKRNFLGETILQPILKEVTDSFSINHFHKENTFVDFDREKLLYQMISNEGPKIAVADINHDGLDDFYIGGAKDESGTLYIQNKNGFSSTNQALFEKDKFSEDTNALFFDADDDKDLDLLVASGSYEFSINSFALIDRLYLNDGKGNFYKSPQLLPTKKPISTSVIANVDFDSDGDEDLFVGGRVTPYAYGIPTSSYLLENDGKGNFKDVTTQRAKELENLGMVTDALWMDFDKDGDQDLIIVGEWMPIRVFSNQDGKFNEITNQVGLNETNGFWNTLEKSDLNNDGYEDLIVGNLGENTFFKASYEKPIRMYVNDFDGNGSVEQVVTIYKEGKAYPVVLKKDITSQMPHLLKKYLKSSDYKEQTISQIFTKDELNDALIYEVFETKSIILWNTGKKFSIQTLPTEAQLSPTYAFHIKDLDNDGTKEIIVGGNQHLAKPQTGIYDASYGLILKSLDNKEFKSISLDASGLFEKGQIRDFDGIQINGKNYLLIGKNNDTLKIYAINNEK